MSLSVDDLVSSFSSSHIGQEAMDLAALQAQLAQTLFYQPPASPSLQSVTRRNSYAQPCNTPTARTPSTSFHFDDRRPSSSTPGAASRPWEQDIPGEEDDAMGDDFVAGSAAAAPLRPSSQPLSPSFSRGSRPTHPYTSPATPTTYDSPSQSLFVSTDPFYIAAAQAPSFHPAPPSFFAQAARPSVGSPFMMSNQQPQPVYSHPIEAETRQVLMAGGQGMFDR
ncbi:hypothetical protein FA95DRAFT_1572600 [Auriscalpium vulgare]|uniref:Uncharacterized protein n=1 Tax=Auriscalpium vulgare TaxID=40419 RepID=A0ACB8RTG6_9AGAM|nr:hypothetical protein FA95DRAFT_1572600 [Auriscalpium vulgare]